MHVCMYAYLYVCMYTCLYVCMYTCLYVCMSVCLYVCTYVCLYVRMYVCMYVRMYVRTYVCTYVHMYVCMSCTALPECLERVLSTCKTSSFTFMLSSMRARDYNETDQEVIPVILLLPKFFWMKVVGCMVFRV